jgi:hypothetical protein
MAAYYERKQPIYKALMLIFLQSGEALRKLSLAIIDKF